MDERDFTLNFLGKLVGAAKLPNWSDQEWDALCGEIPMTQELFEFCLNACAEAGNFPEFLELFERFPGYGRVWAEDLDKELGAITAFLEAEGKEVKKLTNEDIQTRWTAFREDIRNELGDEIAGSLTEDIFSGP